MIISGSPDEVELVETIRSQVTGTTISVCGKTTFRELASLIKGFNLIITGDTSPMHIASAVNTPVVAIFGPSKSQETGPYANNCRIVERDFPCRLTCDESVCRHKVYQACMRAIIPDDVFTAASELIG